MTAEQVGEILTAFKDLCTWRRRGCNHKDVKRVQMKSQSRPHNKYEGEIVNMCEECRRGQNGSFKYVK